MSRADRFRSAHEKAPAGRSQPPGVARREPPLILGAPPRLRLLSTGACRRPLRFPGCSTSLWSRESPNLHVGRGPSGHFLVAPQARRTRPGTATTTASTERHGTLENPRPGGRGVLGKPTGTVSRNRNASLNGRGSRPTLPTMAVAHVRSFWGPVNPISNHSQFVTQVTN